MAERSTGELPCQGSDGSLGPGPGLDAPRGGATHGSDAQPSGDLGEQEQEQELGWGVIREFTCTMACAQSFPDRTAPSMEAKYFCFV